MELVSLTELGLKFLFKQINIFLPIYIKAFRCTKSCLFFFSALDVYYFHF